MDDTMVPPLKRRKLSSSAEGDIAYLDDTKPSTDSSSPSYSHAVESIHPPSSLAPPRTDDEEDVEQEPQQVLQHAPVEGIQHFEVIVPRQDALSSPTFSSISSAFFTYPPSPTITFPVITSASIPAATIPAGVTPSADSGSGQDASNSSSSSSSLSSSTSESSTLSRYVNNGTSLTSSLASSQPIAAAITSSSANSTISAASETTHSSSTTLHSNATITTTSTDTAILFLATLSDGDVTTITRHSGAFTTTLLDGERVTIPGISTARTSTRTSSDPSTSTSDESSLTSVATITPSPTYNTAGSNVPVLSSVAPTPTAASNGHGNNNDSTPPAGTIAGGVVGGAAGLAVVVLIAMLFVRWYRRKSNGQHRALPTGLGDSPDHDGMSGPEGPGMAERAGLMPLMSAVPAFFRHQNRSTADSSERGFTRVSGRKLPSAFSEGMSSEAIGSQPQQQPTMPLAGAGADAGLDRNLSNDSLYRENYAYAGTASPTSPASPASPISQSSSAPIRNSVHEMMTMAPGPQRQPQVHSGGPYAVPPSADVVPGSSRTVSAATFNRSDTPSSLRNSRFTEEDM